MVTINELIFGRSTRNTRQVKDFNWANILSTDPEKIVRSAASLSQHSTTPKEDLNISNKTPSPELTNPTPAMLQILSRKKENIRSPIKAKIIEPQVFNVGSAVTLYKVSL